MLSSERVRSLVPTDALSVRELIALAADAWGDAPALWSPTTPRALSYRELGAETEKFARTLADWGLGPAHRVATLLPAGATAVGTMCGVMSQCTYTPLNPRSSHAEAMASLVGTKADCIIVPRGQMNAGRSAAEALGLPVIDVSAPPDGAPGAVELTCHTEFEARVRDASGPPLAYVLQTSGTTSRPKFVPMSHAAFLSAMSNNATNLKMSPRDRSLHLIAPAHVMGITTVLYSLMGGSQIVCCPGLVAADLFDWVRRFKPTWLTTPPALHHSIVTAAAKTDVSFIAKQPLRFVRSGAAMMPPTLLMSIESLWHAPLIEAYGMSECPLITSNGWEPGGRKAGSVGLGNPGAELGLRDDDGQITPAGGCEPDQVGEIVIRGPHVFTGYEDAEEANRDAFRDGWFHTGDLGSFDDDGFLFYRGRKKELINRGGTKIAPQEIDETVLRHPAVSEAVTFALPDDRLGETIAVAVVLRDAQSATELDIQQHVARELSAEKVPERVAFVEALPTGITGKNLRLGLAEKLGLDMNTTKKAAVTFAAASDPVEDALIEIWQHVLQHPRPMSVDAHFVSDLGGDSLDALEMLAEASRVFGRDLPVAKLLGAPTIRKLAAEFRKVTTTRASHLVPIQTDGDLPPLFCFPGMHGNAFSFYPLARALGNQAPVYAFTLPGVYGDGEPLAASIKELAAQFLSIVRAVQPVGPYRFAGYSFGGYLAIEMALQLAAQGECVSRLIMFDTRGPGYPQRRGLVGRSLFHLRRVARGNWLDRRTYFFERFSKLRDNALAAEQASPVQTGPGRPNISAHSVKLIRAYEPRFYDGRITLFRAAEQAPWFDACVPDMTMGWGRWAQHVDVHTVSGTHITVLERDRVAPIAKILRSLECAPSST